MSFIFDELVLLTPPDLAVQALVNEIVVNLLEDARYIGLLSRNFRSRCPSVNFKKVEIDGGWRFAAHLSMHKTSSCGFGCEVTRRGTQVEILYRSIFPMPVTELGLLDQDPRGDLLRHASVMKAAIKGSDGQDFALPVQRELALDAFADEGVFILESTHHGLAWSEEAYLHLALADHVGWRLSRKQKPGDAEIVADLDARGGAFQRRFLRTATQDATVPRQRLH